MTDSSDPKIVDRLKGFPPYGDEPATPVIPQEDINQETEVPVEDIKEEEQIVEPVKEVEPTEEEALENSKNPERTKEYIEKLKTQNKELKTYKNVLESLTPNNTIEDVIPTPQWPASPTTNVIPQNVPGLSQTQVNELFKGLVDENGYVDSGLLKEELQAQKERNDKLQQELKNTQVETKQTNQRLDDFERNETMRDIHGKYPRLDPVNVDETLPEDKKFNGGLWEYVRKNMVSEWVNEAATGKVVDPNDKMAQKARLERITAKGMEALNAGVLTEEGEIDINLLGMKKTDKDKLQQVDAAKRNINASGNSQTGQRNTYSTHEALVKATMAGKPGALAERLRQAGQ